MIEQNMRAFANLAAQLSTLGHETVNGTRYFKTDENEKEWLKNVVLNEVHRVLPGVTGLKVSLDDVFYLIVVGSSGSNENIDPEILVEFENNAGIVTLLISEGLVKLKPGILGLSFYNEIMFQHEDSAYRGHDFNDVLEYVDELAIFKIPENSILLAESLSKILCYYVSSVRNNVILNFSAPVLDYYRQISLTGIRQISYELIINSMLSTNFQHAFLELYRLVERLYPLHYLKEFHEAVDTQMSFMGFAASLESTTGWRPKEEDAIEKIFSNSTDNIRAQFAIVIDDGQDYKYMYKLRNSIVHFRASHNALIVDDERWNNIILGCLMLIEHAYATNERFL